jgi:hypothetical protein
VTRWSTNWWTGSIRCEQDAKWDRRLGELRADLIKWMFLFWAGTTFTILGAVIALIKL